MEGAYKGIVQLEEAYKDHQVLLPDHVSANQKLKHIIKGIILIPLEAQGINNLKETRSRV